MIVRVAPAGDAAVMLELQPAAIDPLTSATAIAIAAAVRRRCGAALRDVVVGYCSVTVFFDPLAADGAWVEQELRAAASEAEPEDGSPGAMIDIPVCYGGDDFGPDLAEVAAAAGLTEDEVVGLHAGVTYRVYVVGFTPGFAYMAPVDARLALPRRATPRPRVPPGSVAIAAGQTGIYPGDTPGGWHIIGRTPVKPFDPDRPQPFMFRPGDQVRFRPAPREIFDGRTP